MALVLVLAADRALARESAEGAIQSSPGHRPGYLVLPVLKGLKARPILSRRQHALRSHLQPLRFCHLTLPFVEAEKCFRPEEQSRCDVHEVKAAAAEAGTVPVCQIGGLCVKRGTGNGQDGEDSAGYITEEKSLFTRRRLGG